MPLIVRPEVPIWNTRPYGGIIAVPLKMTNAPLTRVFPCTTATSPGKSWMVIGLPAAPLLFMIWL